MKILIFASCSKRKAWEHPDQPKCSDIKSKNEREEYSLKFPKRITAKDFYKGMLNVSTNVAIEHLRKYFEVSYYVISAGFGIIEEKAFVPPYDCTFSGKTSNEIITRAKLLEIPDDFQKLIIQEKPDLIYLALGKDYLLSLGEWDKNLPCTTIAFDKSQSKKVISLPASNIEVIEFAAINFVPIHGTIGYKGDLLLITTRFLNNQKNPVEALQKLLKKPEDFLYLSQMIREGE